MVVTLARGIDPEPPHGEQDDSDQENNEDPSSGPPSFESPTTVSTLTSTTSGYNEVDQQTSKAPVHPYSTNENSSDKTLGNVPIQAEVPTPRTGVPRLCCLQDNNEDQIELSDNCTSEVLTQVIEIRPNDANNENAIQLNENPIAQEPVFELNAVAQMERDEVLPNPTRARFLASILLIDDITCDGYQILLRNLFPHATYSFGQMFDVACFGSRLFIRAMASGNNNQATNIRNWTLTYIAIETANYMVLNSPDGVVLVVALMVQWVTWYYNRWLSHE